MLFNHLSLIRYLKDSGNVLECNNSDQVIIQSQVQSTAITSVSTQMFFTMKTQQCHMAMTASHTWIYLPVRSHTIGMYDTLEHLGEFVCHKVRWWFLTGGHSVKDVWHTATTDLLKVSACFDNLLIAGYIHMEHRWQNILKILKY